MGRPLPTNFQLRSMGAAPPQNLSVEGIEIVQTVQEPNNSVSLVADKRTVVRVYVGTQTTVPVQVRGTLKLDNGSTQIVVNSLGAITVDPAQNGNLLFKRGGLANGLVFNVPAALRVSGSLTIRVDELVDANTGVSFGLSGSTNQIVNFTAGPPLRLRLLGIRYSTVTGANQIFHTPSQLDIDLISSWLERAYPVPAVDMTYSVINAPSGFQPGQAGAATTINALLSAVRTQDVANGTDQRTHYFGVVSDAGGFMRGRASGIPSTPNPNIVASGPTGPNTWGWDFDGSYGDWYTGHELGHTFGRFHPGFCNGNSSDDPAFPYPNGQLSDNQPAYVGYDAGDTGNGIMPAALPGQTWHDVMTYCEFQWLSSYTYEGIFQRLLAEDALGSSGSGVQPPAHVTDASGTGATMLDTVNVVATINLTQQTGNIAFVTPVAAPQTTGRQSSSSNTVIRILDANDATLVEYSVKVSLESCVDANADQTGIVNETIQIPDNGEKLQLVRDGKVLDTFESQSPITPVRNIRLLQGAAPPLEALTWDSDEAADPKVTYIVQVSSDDGTTWQTISLGQATPRIEFDKSQYQDTDTLKVRVRETNGFQVSNETIETISLK